MNTRALVRWMLSIVMALGLLGAIGLALNPPVQARVASTFDWPGLSPCDASLQQCLDAAVVQSGDMIHIMPGVYTASVTLSKAVSLIGDNAQTTILNAELFQRVLTVTGNSITTSVVISGLTLANGNPIGGGCPGACGGGVLITDTAHSSFIAVQIIGNNAEFGGGLFVHSGGAILNKSSVANNHATQSGGGVLVEVGSAELFNSLIVSNTAAEGGGVYVRGLSGTTASIVGGKVESNAANGYGGGVYAGGTLYISGTRFYGNSAYDGSALEITGTARTRVVNAFVARNPANGAFPGTNASARFDSSADSVVLHTTFANATQPFTRALVVNSGAVTVANTIVASYAAGLSQFGGRLTEDYNLFFSTPVTFTGSISHGGHSLFGLDPLFKGPATDDYHIKGLSPAVNNGANVGVRRDIDLDARPLGGGFDIGADEASVAGMTPGPNTGGSFTYTTTQNSTINLDVPSGAVTQTTPIYCSLINTATLQLPGKLKFAGVVFELDADLDPVNVVPGSISFNVPVTLSVSYTAAELAAAGITDELSLKLYRFEPAQNGWRPIGYRPNETQTLDAANNVITATILGFSRFGKLGATTGYDVFLPIISRGS